MEWEELDKRIRNAYSLVQKLDDHEGIFIIADSKGEWYFLKVVSSDTIHYPIVEQLHQAEIAGVNRIVEHFIVDERCYLIKEYIHGTNLFDEILLQGLYAEADVLNMLLSLCASLRKLYQAYGLIFKDLHPKNVMIQNGSYILVDTETVRTVKENRSSDTQVIGVAGFMAPEQYGFAQSTIQSDMYSLAMIARFAMTAEIPTLVKNQIDLDESVCSKVTQSILDKMTAFAPEKRYRDYADCMRALQLARKGRRPITGRQALLVIGIFALVLGIYSWRMTGLLLENPVEETEYTVPLEEERNEEPLVLEEPDPIGVSVVNSGACVAERLEGFEADWTYLEHEMIDSPEGQISDLTFSYLQDDEYLYIQADYRARLEENTFEDVSVVLANGRKGVDTVIKNGTKSGQNQWVVKMEKSDLALVSGYEENADFSFYLAGKEIGAYVIARVEVPFEGFTIEEEGVFPNNEIKRSSNRVIQNFGEIPWEDVTEKEGTWLPLSYDVIGDFGSKIEMEAIEYSIDHDQLYLRFRYVSQVHSRVEIQSMFEVEGFRTTVDNATIKGSNDWIIKADYLRLKELTSTDGYYLLQVDLLDSLPTPGNGVLRMEVPGLFGRGEANVSEVASEVIAPFEADWHEIAYSADSGIEQYVWDLSVNKAEDEAYLYYRFRYSTDLQSDIALFNLPGAPKQSGKFIHNGTVSGTNDWVLRIEKQLVEGNIGDGSWFAVDLFDSQPFSRVMMQVPFAALKGTQSTGSDGRIIANTQVVSLELVEDIQGEWSPLHFRYLDGSETRMHDVSVLYLEQQDSIFLTVSYPADVVADVIFFLPGDQEGLQAKMKSGTRVGENQWTVRISRKDWDSVIVEKGITELVMNLMLDSKNNPGNIMMEIP